MNDDYNTIFEYVYEEEMPDRRMRELNDGLSEDYWDEEWDNPNYIGHQEHYV